MCIRDSPSCALSSPRQQNTVLARLEPCPSRSAPDLRYSAARRTLSSSTTGRRALPCGASTRRSRTSSGATQASSAASPPTPPSSSFSTT
eukprot:3884128-Rhodomonas_salina.1